MFDELINGPILFDEGDGGGEANPNPEANPAPDGQGNEPDAPKPEEKTLTQSEVNAIIAREKKKAEKAAREAYEAEQKKKDMTEAERYKTEKEEADKARQEAEARAVRAERKAQLAGKVADVDAALKLIEDAHLDDEGNVNTDVFLKAYPFLAIKTAKTPIDAPNGGGDGTGKFNAAGLSKEEFEKLQQRVAQGERITLK